MSQSTKDALMRYYQNQLPKNTERKKKNGTPEKLVEKDVLLWCKNAGWFINVVESKAVFSAKSGIYHHGQTVQGTPDLIGCSNTGLFVAIELKAKGRVSTLRDAQRRYICEVISRNGFACVVDSVDRLAEIWRLFNGSLNKKATLLEWLPREKSVDTKPLFED